MVCLFNNYQSVVFYCAELDVFFCKFGGCQALLTSGWASIDPVWMHKFLLTCIFQNCFSIFSRILPTVIGGEYDPSYQQPLMPALGTYLGPLSRS